MFKFAKHVSERLGYLQKISTEEQQIPPAAASVEDFLAFLSRNKEFECPSIVLTPSGNVRAEWSRGPDQHFAIEFQGNDNVRFVVFATNQRHTSGVTTTDNVMKLVELHGLIDLVIQ